MESRVFLSLLFSLLFLHLPLAARDEVRIVGSATIFPFAAAVAEEAARNHNMKTPIVEATGTGGGIKLFCQGIGERTPDIVMASRPMTEKERTLCAQHQIRDIFEMKIGMDGIALVSSQKRPLLSLSLQQLYEALAYALPSPRGRFKTTFRKWSDIDASLPDLKIAVMGPPPSSGTRDAFLELVMEPFCKNAPDFEERPCSSFREDGGYIDAGENENLIIQKLISNSKLFGIVSFSYLEQNKDKIHAAPIDGIPPTLRTISSGTYPLSRPLYLYIKRDHMASHPEISIYLQEFQDPRASGPEGYLTEKGLIPLAPSEQKHLRENIEGLLGNI